MNFLKKYFSSYHPIYPRSLVYMLQASGYGIEDFFIWYFRVKDFRTVEKRQSLDTTTKAKLFLFLTRGLWVFWLAVGLAVIWQGEVWLGLLLILTWPYAVALGLIGLSVIFSLTIQKYFEYRALRQMARRLENHSGFKIAIAGSFGKTTMREILKTVLAEKMTVSAPAENYNTPLGLSSFVNDLSGDEEVIIFELGEYRPGDIRSLARAIKPDLDIITGINEAHLSRFKSLDQTVSAIYELGEFVTGKKLYVNGESPLALKAVKPDNLIYVRESVNGWKISSVKTSLEGTSFEMTNGQDKISLNSPLLGLHQIGPLAVAVDIAWNLGLSAEEVKAGVAKTKPFKHRLEPKTEPGGFVLIDDSYNGNPDGVRVAIEFLAGLENKKRFYLTPGLVEMGSATTEVHRAIGHQLAEAKIENVILVNNSVTDFIKQGLREKNYSGQIHQFDSMPEALVALGHLTLPGDVVLLQNDWPDQYQ